MTELMQLKYKKMEAKLIKTEKDYRMSLSRMGEIFQAKKGTKEGDELELLAILIEDYENKHYAIEPPDPIDAIKYKMEQKGLNKKQMTKYFGSQSKVTEVLQGKRNLTLTMIKKLYKEFGISADVLLNT